jgi:AhpD family alkylhydroperoxidase
MAKLIEEAAASPEVAAVFADIKRARNVNWVGNFWKAIAVHPPTLRRIWENIRQVMGPGDIDPVTKEMLYIAVSISNNCAYCIASHTAAARAKGMTEAQLAELRAIVGLASETNRLAVAYDVPVDTQFTNVLF